MKKSILFTSLVLLVVAGTSQAGVIEVSFAGLGSTFADITAPNPPFTVGPVTFSYENFGAGSMAFVTSAGVTGVTDTVGIPNIDPTLAVLPPVPGILTLDFAWGINQLSFNYSILGATGPVTNAVAVSFLPSGGGLPVDGGVFDTTSFDATSGIASGIYGFTGGSFLSQASVFFSTAGSGFEITSMDVSVPEPGTLALTGSFLLMLGLGSRRLLKRRS